MAKNSSATINWIVGGIAAYFVGSAIAGAIRRSKGTSGIGDVPVWNKGHIRNWFAYEHYNYPEKIIVNISNRPYYINDGCWEVYSYANRDAKHSYNRTFSIREKDVDYLREMCKKYGVDYVEY